MRWRLHFRGCQEGPRPAPGLAAVSSTVVTALPLEEVPSSEGRGSGHGVKLPEYLAAFLETPQNNLLKDSANRLGNCKLPALQEANFRQHALNVINSPYII